MGERHCLKYLLARAALLGLQSLLGLGHLLATANGAECVSPVFACCCSWHRCHLLGSIPVLLTFGLLLCSNVWSLGAWWEQLRYSAQGLRLMRLLQQGCAVSCSRFAFSRSREADCRQTRTLWHLQDYCKWDASPTARNAQSLIVERIACLVC